MTVAHKAFISLLLSVFLTAGLIILAHSGVFDWAENRYYLSADVPVTGDSAGDYGAGLFILYRPDFVLSAAVFITLFLVVFFIFNLKRDPAENSQVNVIRDYIPDAAALPFEKQKESEQNAMAPPQPPSLQNADTAADELSGRTAGRGSGLLAAADILLSSLPETPGAVNETVIYEQDGIPFINNGAFYTGKNSGGNLDNNFIKLVESVTGEKP